MCLDVVSALQSVHFIRVRLTCFVRRLFYISQRLSTHFILINKFNLIQINSFKLINTISQASYESTLEGSLHIHKQAQRENW